MKRYQHGNIAVETYPNTFTIYQDVESVGLSIDNTNLNALIQCLQDARHAAGQLRGSKNV